VSTPRQAPDRLLRPMFGTPATTSTMSFVRGVVADIQHDNELLRWGASLERAAGSNRVTAWRWDFRTRKLQYGPHFREIFGFSPDEPVNYETWRGHLHPSIREEATRSFLQFLEGRSRHERIEQPYITASGETHWVEIRRRVERNSRGKPLRITSLCIDITEAKGVELALRESEEHFRALFEQTAVGIARLDLDGKYLQVNDTFCDITGYSRQELLQMSISDIRHPENLKNDPALLKRITSGNISHDVTEERCVRKDGSIAWILRSLSLGRNAVRAPQCFISVIEDITDRKRVEQQLLENEEFLLLAQSAAAIGIWEWDPTTGQRKWSPQNYLLFGIAEDQEAPTMEAWLNLVHPEDRPRMSELWQLIEQERQESFEVEFRAQRAAGDVRWIRCRGRVQRANAGSAIRVFGANYDVTASREAEETTRRAEKLAVAGRMAAKLAHEINNPLLALSNLLYLIFTCSSLDDARMYSVMAQRQLQRVTQFTTHTLQFQRQTSSPAPARISEIVDTITVLQEQRLQRKNVEITRDFRDTHLLTCWRDDLRQLFGNLISNALEAVPNAGRIVLRVFERTNYRTGEAGVCASIADTGWGMSAEVKTRLFEPFFTTKGITALGIGLWVSSEIVNKHQGSIRIRSRQGKQHHGTVASVFLPFHPGESSLLAAA